jgi:hypothetical protein
MVKKGKKMALNKNMNWIELGNYIIAQIEKSVSRDTIESSLKKAFGWTDRQAFSATDPYYDVKRFKSMDVKRKIK